MAPTVLFCERCSNVRNELATGSFVDPWAAGEAAVLAAGVEDCARANAAEAQDRQRQKYVSRKASWAFQHIPGLTVGSSPPCASPRGRPLWFNAFHGTITDARRPLTCS